ncbi:MAG: type II toxin-antitoxin system PemK/MazF family toxin [Dehalococcoidia bacterium]
MVNDDDIGVLPLKIIGPVTEWNDRFELFPWMVRLEPNADNGLSKQSAADTSQVRSVANQRFVRRLGVVSDENMRMIERAIAVVLHL